MNAYIKAIDYYLPEKILTNEELVKEFPEWSVEKIAEKVGVNKRHIAAENETASDLAIKAAEKLFESAKIDKSEINFVLFCTQSSDYFLPTTACIIQDKLGLPTNCGALDFNQGCSGYIYGLSLAKGLIAAGISKNVLLLTGETYTKRIHPKDKGNRTIFGDAASATLISTDGFAEIGEFCLGTDGSGAEDLIVKTGASRYPQKTEIVHFDEETGSLRSDDYIFMNGGEIFSFTLSNVPKLINETLVKNGWKKENVDFFAFHQANKYMLDYLKKKIKIPDEKFLEYLSEVGNTVSSTIPIMLCEMFKSRKFTKSNKIILAGFGVGFSWGGVGIELC